MTVDRKNFTVNGVTDWAAFSHAKRLEAQPEASVTLKARGDVSPLAPLARKERSSGGTRRGSNDGLTQEQIEAKRASKANAKRDAMLDVYGDALCDAMVAIVDAALAANPDHEGPFFIRSEEKIDADGNVESGLYASMARTVTPGGADDKALMQAARFIVRGAYIPVQGRGIRIA